MKQTESSPLPSKEYISKTGAILVPRLVDVSRGVVVYTNSVTNDLHTVSISLWGQLLSTPISLPAESTPVTSSDEGKPTEATQQEWKYIYSKADLPKHGGQVNVSWGFTKDFRNGGPFVDQARWEKAYGWTTSNKDFNDVYLYAWKDLPRPAVPPVAVAAPSTPVSAPQETAEEAWERALTAAANAFNAHIHVARHDYEGDEACAKCGKNFRDSVHLRVGETVIGRQDELFSRPYIAKSVGQEETKK